MEMQGWQNFIQFSFEVSLCLPVLTPQLLETEIGF